MVDIGISSAPAGAGPVTASRSSQSAKGDSQGDGNGFFDILTNTYGGGRTASGNGQDDASDATSDPKAPAQDDSVEDEQNALPGTRSHLKPLIDLQKTSFKQRLMQDGQEAVATGQKQPVKGQKPDGKTVRQSADGSTDIDAAKDDAETGETRHAASTVKHVASVADDGEQKAEQPHSKEAASDALSLLHGQADATAVPSLHAAAAAPFAAQAAANMLPANAHQQVSTQRTVKEADRTSVKDAPSSGQHAATAETGTDDTDVSGQTFKLVRADGRGQSVQMSVGKDREETTDSNVRSSGSPGMDTVAVLDSRRYLGLAPGSNSSSVVGTLSGDPEWSRAMDPGSALSNAASWTSTGKVVNTLKIQMNPADLGLVTATMRLSGDELTVDLKVQSGEAYRQLHNDQGAMADALRAQGYQVDKITITLAAPAQTDTGSQSGFQGQSQQQSLPNQGQGGAQTREQNYAGQRGNNGNDGGWSSGEPGAADGTSGGSQRGGSGGVYL